MDIKIIADPIHGMMIFEPYLVKIINHPYFQRLRHIKQLQGVEHVYPGGVHSRFSHSLGVCFLAGKVLDHLEKLIETEKTKYKISNFERKCVEISALCHDIGHGPFSHLYESLINEIDENPLEHEARSVEIAKTIIDDLCLFENKKERKFAKKVIGEMIQGKKVEDMTAEEKKKAFLYQIVNNKNNGVDVDKWDYFIRDSHACGFPSNFDKERAVSVLRVRPYETDIGIQANVLAFPLKDQINLYNMFSLRFTLHSKVYQHIVVKSVEEMIFDVLKLADNTKILNGNSVSTKECRDVTSIENNCLMDDRLMYLIYHASDSSVVKGTKSKANNLKHARAIMDRIHKRDFYHCIYKMALNSHEKEIMIQKQKKAIEKKLEEKFVEHVKRNLQRKRNQTVKEKRENHCMKKLKNTIGIFNMREVDEEKRKQKRTNFKKQLTKAKEIYKMSYRKEFEEEKRKMRRKSKIQFTNTKEIYKTRSVYEEKKQKSEKIIEENKKRQWNQQNMKRIRRAKEKKIKEKNSKQNRNQQNEVAYKKILNEINRLKNERRIFTENIGGLFRIRIVKVNYGNEDKNPIPNVFFYDKGEDSVIEYQRPEKSPMVPECFEEITLRVICTLSKPLCDSIQLEKDFHTDIESVFERFVKLSKKRKLHCSHPPQIYNS